MHNRYKRFLLIFMMLALPVQAFASVALLGCEMSISPDENQAAMASMDHAMSGCHEAPAEAPSVPVSEHQCSHCAACYLAAAFPIPISGTTFVAPTPYVPHLQPAELLSGFIPEGPERPPRAFLA